ncbi:MAG: HlyD family efflux transporter periplasmic adaptor subunit [Gemmatimonadota bacterium]|nr:HlyD family efflux transporter periplasmic adaptor subunit [Gemmatimonadota bacterium]
MKKRMVIGVVVVALGGLAGWLILGNGSDDVQLTASGTVEATDAHLGFLVAGRVAEVLVDEGQTVTAGTVLARLDARELDARRDAARADVEAAEAALAEMEAGSRGQEIASAEAALRSARRRLEEAEENAERAVVLFEGGAISRQAYDRAQAERDIARSAAEQAAEALELVREGPRPEAIRAARARLEQTRARLASAEAIRSHALIEAPFDGTVTVRHREPGEAVSPGAPVVTLLDPSERWVRIYVRADMVGRLRLGGDAAIVSDTYPDRTVTGEVSFIGSEAEFTPRNVQTAEERTRLVYPVKVRITGDPDLVLKPGLPADVTLEDAGG